MMRGLDMESSTHTANGYTEKLSPMPSSSEHSYDAKWTYRAGHIYADEEEWASPRISCSKNVCTPKKSLSPIARTAVKEEVNQEEDDSSNPTKLSVRNCYNTFKEMGSPRVPQGDDRKTPSRSDRPGSSIRRGGRKRVSDHKSCILKSLKDLDL
eukprot:scaffold15986_cov116-Cylindrotheca_fusiformis.AAC.1